MEEKKSNREKLIDALMVFVMRASVRGATAEEVQALPAVARVLMELRYKG